MRKTLSKSTSYVQRLGRHHFAHLRAVANGIELVESAKRYLGVEHGHQAQTAHRQTRDAVRALALLMADYLIGHKVVPGTELVALAARVKEMGNG